jgi:hypothetical protein
MFTKIGVLLQCRGDWAFYKQVFNFPGWNEASICWRCGCSAAERGYSEEANWRTHRISESHGLAKQIQKGLLPSTIWQCPGFKPEHCMIDWLHTVDQGVGQDALGQLLWEALRKLPGDNKEMRLQCLWYKIKEYYKNTPVASKLDHLTMEMVRKKGTSAKLNSKAAEARGLYKFGLQLAQELLHLAPPGDEHARSVVALFTHLNQCVYITKATPLDVESAVDASKRFCLLYVALEKEALAQGDALSWRVKPKLHLFAELMQVAIRTVGAPHLFWTYQDEGWNSWLAQSGHRRGGRSVPAATALRLLQRFRASLEKLA